MARYLGNANAELIDYCRALRPRYRTGILSNSFVGMSEPDPAISQLGCARLDVEPQETIFVDDRADNIDAATELGMITILHRDNAQTIARINDAIS